ncbi:molybdate ABC transporter substrate-binding protein [Litchfieldia salsa]|uniref:Molybdate transport system substrate-binding protein n=1 Tax=Litchfieldia salsa TaxID=930152 RepID=A0A1H0WY43_9BACI|nr:molybdate ABC transporter substrate-binding protein [Litchfieldia salsa]SDP95684.1 molybdate transport system substrate-binding protein [Litchfieldia salsa]
MKKVSFLFLLFLVVACSNESNSTKEEITISAASSLTNVLLEIKKEFEIHNEFVEVHLNFGSSGTLQKQIEQGAPVDLFVSASSSHFKTLLDKEMIDQNSVVNLLTNELVLVKNKASELAISDFSDLTNENINTIAIGIPETVPVGHYSKELLQEIGLWETIQPKIVLAKDVRQVLTYIETNNVDVGIVYSSDAHTSNKIEVIAKANKNHHSPIFYEVGIIHKSEHKELAKEFSLFLQSESSVEIFKQYGFKPLIN